MDNHSLLGSSQAIPLLVTSKYASFITSFIYSWQQESDPVTGIEPTEAEDGCQIVHCDFYDQTKKSYCKKLKASCVRHSGMSTYRGKGQSKEEAVEVCSCPLHKGGFCLASRKACILHQDWENVRQANIYLLELSVTQTQKSLNYYQKVRKNPMHLKAL